VAEGPYSETENHQSMSGDRDDAVLSSTQTGNLVLDF